MMERIHKIITVLRDILFVLGILGRIFNALENYYKKRDLEARGYVREVKGGSNYKGTTIGFTKV